MFSTMVLIALMVAKSRTIILGIIYRELMVLCKAETITHYELHQRCTPVMTRLEVSRWQR